MLFLFYRLDVLVTLVWLAFLVWMLYSMIRHDLGIFRRLWRNPRFSVFSMFLMTAVVAVAMSIVRGQGIEHGAAAYFIVGLGALGVGVVVVGLIWLLISGPLERGEAARLKRRFDRRDVIIQPPDPDR